MVSLGMLCWVCFDFELAGFCCGFDLRLCCLIVDWLMGLGSLYTVGLDRTYFGLCVVSYFLKFGLV